MDIQICMLVQKQQLQLDMEQQTGSKFGKEYVKAVYCHLAYLTYMQSTLCKMPGWINHKLESRLVGEISIISDMQMKPPLWQKVKNQRASWWKWKFSSVQFSRSVVSNSLQPHEPQHTRSPCPSPTPGVHPNPCPLSQWCHPTISSFFSSCPQSFSASGSLQMNQLSISGGQRIGVSASISVLPMNTQDWSSLGWTSWISLQSKGLSRAFSNTTVQNHPFFGARLSL